MGRRGWLGWILLLAACGTKGGAGGVADGAEQDAALPSLDAEFLPLTGDASATGCCSSDLREAIDCETRQVLATCPADQGCSPAGGCVAPCDSATANRSSVGCEYYALTPDAYSRTADAPLEGGTVAGSCFAAFVANTWTTPVTVRVEYAGRELDISKSAYSTRGSGANITYVPLSGGAIPPDEVAILFLTQSAPGDGSDPTLTDRRVLCPAGTTPAYIASDPAVHGTGKGNAFHITTSAPVVAFDIYPYGGASAAVTGATLLLPTSAWDTNYVATSAYASEPNPSLPGSPTYDGNVAFVAAQDHTSIAIAPAAAIVGGGGVEPAPSGTAHTYVLDAGELLQLEQPADLSGSVVLADKPIGTWGGHWAMDIPATAYAADAAHQQLPPVRAMGSEYVAVRYRTRTDGVEESVPWRLVGAVDGTRLTYEPSAPAGAPATLSRGQVVEFASPGPFVVESQDAAHPFYAAAHMTGGDLGNMLGDPETVGIVPRPQFLDHYVFFTDPTYGETNLVVVRDAGGKDVQLDCLPTPLIGWQPVGTRYEYTRVDVQHGGMPVGMCDNGRHTMTSAAPFGVTVWGFDHAVSYAYPAGAGFRPINTTVVPPMPR